MSDRQLVSAKICARALGITTGSLYRMGREGIIPSYRVGVRKRSVRFDVAEAREALRQEVEQPDE